MLKYKINRMAVRNRQRRNMSEEQNIVKKVCAELGITQKELAQVCNLSHNGISRIEVADSDIKLSTLLKMSKFLRYKIILEMDEGYITQFKYTRDGLFYFNDFFNTWVIAQGGSPVAYQNFIINISPIE